jgi:hypothetical protein
VLVLAVVADRFACGVDAAGQRGFGDDAALPYRREEIILAHHAIAALH